MHLAVGGHKHTAMPVLLLDDLLDLVLRTVSYTHLFALSAGHREPDRFVSIDLKKITIGQQAKAAGITNAAWQSR